METSVTNNDKSCLSESECLSLGNIALKVHQFYGNARDIEWGIKDNKIHLLQSRPITNLDNSWTQWELMHDIDSGQQSEKEYLTRANLGEVFPGASSHVCLSWLTNCWNANGFVRLISFVSILTDLYFLPLFYHYFRDNGKNGLI
jgi:hypothetical protein